MTTVRSHRWSVYVYREAGRWTWVARSGGRMVMGHWDGDEHHAVADALSKVLTGPVADELRVTVEAVSVVKKGDGR